MWRARSRSAALLDVLYSFVNSTPLCFCYDPSSGGVWGGWEGEPTLGACSAACQQTRYVTISLRALNADELRYSQNAACTHFALRPVPTSHNKYGNGSNDNSQQSRYVVTDTYATRRRDKRNSANACPRPAKEASRKRSQWADGGHVARPRHHFTSGTRLSYLQDRCRGKTINYRTNKWIISKTNSEEISLLFGNKLRINYGKYIIIPSSKTSYLHRYYYEHKCN